MTPNTVKYRLQNINSRFSCTLIHRVLPKIINKDQNTYVKSRYIGYNLSLMEDLFHYNNQAENNCFIKSCDFEKAFDSIEIQIY